MNYEQFIQSEISRYERLPRDIRTGRVLWCDYCGSWVPVEEMRPDPCGGDWPMCIDCIADQGLDENLLEPAESGEEKKDLKEVKIRYVGPDDECEL